MEFDVDTHLAAMQSRPFSLPRPPGNNSRNAAFKNTYRNEVTNKSPSPHRNRSISADSGNTKQWESYQGVLTIKDILNSAQRLGVTNSIPNPPPQSKSCENDHEQPTNVWPFNKGNLDIHLGNKSSSTSGRSVAGSPYILEEISNMTKTHEIISARSLHLLPNKASPRVRVNKVYSSSHVHGANGSEKKKQSHYYYSTSHHKRSRSSSGALGLGYEGCELNNNAEFNQNGSNHNGSIPQQRSNATAPGLGNAKDQNTSKYNLKYSDILMYSTVVSTPTVRQSPATVHKPPSGYVGKKPEETKYSSAASLRSISMSRLPTSFSQSGSARLLLASTHDTADGHLRKIQFSSGNSMSSSVSSLSSLKTSEKTSGYSSATASLSDSPKRSFFSSNRSIQVLVAPSTSTSNISQLSQSSADKPKNVRLPVRAKSSNTTLGNKPSASSSKDGIISPNSAQNLRLSNKPGSCSNKFVARDRPYSASSAEAQVVSARRNSAQSINQPSQAGTPNGIPAEKTTIKTQGVPMFKSHELVVDKAVLRSRMHAALRRTHAMELSPEMLLDGSVREMPVTHTLTDKCEQWPASKTRNRQGEQTALKGEAPMTPPPKAELTAEEMRCNRAPSFIQTLAASQRKNDEMPREPPDSNDRSSQCSESETDREGVEDEEVEGNAFEPGEGEDDDYTINDFEDDVEGDDEEDDSEDGFALQQTASTTNLRSSTRRLLGLDVRKQPKTPLRSATSDNHLSSTNKLQPRPTSAVSAASAQSTEQELQPALIPSLFSYVPPTINFVGIGEKVEQLPWAYRKLLKWRMSTITPNVVKNTIARSYFKPTKKASNWVGYWGKHMKAEGFKAIREYQKINHFPGSFQIGRKDRLWRNLSKMQVLHNKKEFNFFPQTFVLPSDLKLLKRAWDEGGVRQKWIMKPPASARGIGIRLVHKWNQIPKRKPVIVQRYLSHPYLINDSKFDMRLYVYVTSYDPLRIYLYDDGLARFASVKYSTSLKNINNKFMHLTNYSVNKKNSEYKSNADQNLCEGHKWTLKSLWAFLRSRGINTVPIWENIKDLVIKTIIVSEPFVNPLLKSNVRRRYCCHELFGFDVMLDENLKAWIIEVNISPSLHSNSALDVSVKGGMIKDLFNIAGFMLPDKRDIKEPASAKEPASVSSSDSSICSSNSETIFMDRRLYPGQFSPDERVKHSYFSQKHSDEKIQSQILDVLTPDDVRMLVETMDEDSRSGHFECIYPNHTTAKYLSFFEQPRYYNLLLNEWFKRWQLKKVQAINCLESLCVQKLHLENPTCNPRHQWNPPSSSLTMMRTATSQNSKVGGPSVRLTKRNSESKLSVPQSPTTNTAPDIEDTAEPFCATLPKEAIPYESDWLT